MAFAVLALVVTGFATVTLPASAAVPAAVLETETESGSVTGPADGAVVGGTAVVFSAPSADGVGYELRWGTDPTVDAETGQLVSVEGGGESLVTTTEHALIDLTGQTYYWQVRSPAGTGTWSTPRSFTIDPEGVGLQLETYPLAEPSTGSPAEAAGPLAGVSGGVWVAGASAFAVLFLAIVLVGARQASREA